MTETRDDHGEDDGEQEQGKRNEAPPAEAMMDSEQRSGKTESPPPMEMDSFQGSGVAEDENTISLSHREK